VVDIARDLLEWWPKEVERRTRVGKQMIEDAEKEGRQVPNLAELTALRANFDPVIEKKVLADWHAQQQTKG
jgi:hypothetical protein